jgi:2-C-methyl-D-erythritol 2,4-cyclodiphosphate synthase
MRVGIGYDSHSFDQDRPMVLGGVAIPDSPGLEGHSDGDAVIHAVIDAILGAASLGSIGTRFPDTDPAYAGADSLLLLEHSVRLLETENYQVVNVDVTVIAQSPQIAPYAERMAERLAEKLHVPASGVSVKGKTNEGLGWIGRGEGLATMAVVLIDQMPDIDAFLASIRSGGG